MARSTLSCFSAFENGTRCITVQQPERSSTNEQNKTQNCNTRKASQKATQSTTQKTTNSTTDCGCGCGTKGKDDGSKKK